MKLHTITALLTFASVATALSSRQAHHNVVAKRQATTTSSSSSSRSSSTPSGSASASGSRSASSGGPTPSGSASSTSGGPAPTENSAPAPSPDAAGVRPLKDIKFGMPTGSQLPVTATYSKGAIPPYSGAPPLPTAFVFSPKEWPAQDKIPDTSSEEVQQWMLELDGVDIPNIAPTVDGSCVNDTVATGEAASRGWWTCGGYTRPTDIVSCPDKLTWGVSFDDGPSPYTQSLLNYLTKKDITATFFVVGSRVIERPAVLIEEYMSGHEISVHTWSHKHLTALTNEQIVAELGWTREAIRRVLGVTPTTMRPPYGDIDDRVRAIALAMGMVPIVWTRTPSGAQFDTNDWRVAGGLVNGTESFSTFNAILGNATLLDTGFIVLQHDLYEITVDLAIGYTLNAALTHNPPFNLEPIGQCANINTADLYFESNTNASFPYASTRAAKTKSKTANGAIAVSPMFSMATAFTLALVGCFLA